MKRRDFIKSSCATCLSITILPVLVSRCTTLTNITGKLVNDGLLLNAEDFKIKDNSSAFRSFVIVRNDALKFPICIYRFNENEYSALWMKCTHQGAELQASGDNLQCLAHGSEFSNKGIVTSGPASINLRTFPVTVNGTEIFVDLRKQS